MSECNNGEHLKESYGARLERLVIEQYRQYLIEKKNKLRTGIGAFKINTNMVEITSIILTDRKTKQRYSLEVPPIQMHYEMVSINPHRLVDICIESVHVNDSGRFVAILVKVLHRVTRGIKT